MTTKLENVVWEIRANGHADGGGGFYWNFLDYNRGYRWTLSGSGTGEYYCELAAGGDPSIPTLDTNSSVFLDSFQNIADFAPDNARAAGSLNPSEWDYADNDTLGYSTIYVRMADDADPDLLDSNGNHGNRAIGYSTGTDYSQQDSANATYTDLVIGNPTTTELTSTTTPFAADDVGNVINITSGTNFTTGRYYIVSVSGSTATVDASVGTAGATGGNGRLGGAMTLTDANLEEATLSTWIKADATHTLTGNISLGVGSSNPSPKCEGYKTTRGDVWDSAGDIVEANRPTVACGANTFTIAQDWWTFKGFIFTTTTASGVYFTSAADQGRIIGCKSTNSSGTANREAFTITGVDDCAIIACEAVSTNGVAIEVYEGTTIYACYAHDSAKGVVQFGNDSARAGCWYTIADTCPIGFQNTGTSDVINCIAYNCSNYGFSTSQDSPMFINCISHTCAIGITIDDFKQNAIIINHNSYNDTTFFTTIPGQRGYRNFQHGTVFTDPGFTDAPNGDFSTGANADGAFPTTMPGGLTTTNIKRGVAQNAAGGASLGFIGYID
jgi:hypothetical protein